LSTSSTHWLVCELTGIFFLMFPALNHCLKD
jgi:hypothetical protein